MSEQENNNNADESPKADSVRLSAGLGSGTNYVCVKTGNTLERKANMFFWRGRYFTGLVDVKTNALYDDPSDSFAKHIGIESSLEKGLIVPSA